MPGPHCREDAGPTNDGHVRGSLASATTAAAYLLLSCCAVATAQTRPAPAAGLRLVPYPKQVMDVQPGSFPLRSAMSIVVEDSPAALRAARDLKDELSRVVPAVAHEVKAASSAAGTTSTRAERRWQLTMTPIGEPASPEMEAEMRQEEESYWLYVSWQTVLVRAGDEVGLLHGIQTLRQLVRANVHDGGIRCVIIEDWPSVKYRGFLDDITRGPSPTLATLEREVRLAALLKMNVFTYYLETQFAFAKHPEIAPKDGSLTPEELKTLVAGAKQYGVEVIGNQQSFGHFEQVLKHERYKPLAETPSVLNPTKEETYQLLDDLYSEQAPLIESPFFNVCCDETEGLGTGPSKSEAAKAGVGGLYARHIRRIHDLLRDKYHKRMMMWGDIILQHPDKLGEIPKDTVMLSWGYDARPSFDAAILPFAKSGYAFFVCPGVSCWNRILPDFDVAVTNIRNYVRDGVKHGALGMLNTTWDDDGENFAAYNWHGLAWGAECAWNASTISVDSFNRRIGGVLFGEEGDEFGQAIALLGKAHRLPGYDGMFDAAFWKPDFLRPPADAAAVKNQAEALLAIVNPAIEHLKQAREHAQVNADILDYYLFGAERMRLMATRQLDLLEVSAAYRAAQTAGANAAEARSSIAKAIELVRVSRETHARFRQRYVDLWNRENRPYALDVVTRRFDTLLGQYDALLSKLGKAAQAAEKTQPLPPAAEIGL